MTVTLHLVEDATFHDGAPITSEDVAFSVEVVKQYHPFKSMLAPVDSVETPDPHTAVLHLSRPHPAILLAMSPALLPVIPKHIYGDGQDLPTHPANLNPVGSGPFRLVEYVPSKSITLDRYDGFFLPGRPYLDHIIIKLEPNPDEQMIHVERQDAHLIPVFTDIIGIDRLVQSEHLIVTPRGYEGVGAINWLALNLLRKPLDDQRVRQAIAYAIDANFVIGQLHHGRSRRATGPIAPDSPFYEPNVELYELDLTKAARLLDEAGYPIRADGTRFTLSIDYIPLLPNQQRDVALYIKRQLAQLGVRVEPRASESLAQWAERIAGWDFDMTMDLVFNWGDPVIGVHRTYLCDNIREGVIWSNTQNYCNPELDDLFAQAERELDPIKRKALYSQIQTIITDDLPIVYINVIPFHTVYNAGLGNPPLTIWGIHAPFDEVYWREPPQLPYAAVPDITAESSPVQIAAIRAIEVLQRESLYDALDILDDPAQGFLDLESTGLHVIAFTREGIVFVDNSDQVSPGMDISGILDLSGQKVLPVLLDAASGKDGGYAQTTGVWPHPRTHQVGSMTTWCGAISDDDVLCAMTWDVTEGEE